MVILALIFAVSTLLISLCVIGATRAADEQRDPRVLPRDFHLGDKQ